MILLGCSVDAVDDDNSWTAVHHCAFIGNHDALSMLLKHEANCNLVDNFGQTALHISCYKGHYKCVKILVEAGACVDSRDKEEATCLDYVEDETIRSYLLRDILVARRTGESFTLEQVL